MADFFRRLFGRQPNTEKAAPDPPVAEEDLPADDSRSTQPMAVAAPLQTRPLPPPKAFQGSSKRIRFGQATDVGQVRGNNQDACLALVASPEITTNPPAICLFIVADGMGGHQEGEVASSLTVQTLSRYIGSEIIIPHLEGREHSADTRTIPEVLSESMLAANRVVQDKVPNGGTTATCAVIRGDLAYIAHVGDSRAYLITDGNMELITRDHSLVRRLQELGQLTEEEAEVHPQRNVLYRAIGQGEALEVDAATRRLPPSSRLMMCSDGMWGVLGDERMAEILAEYSDPQEACERLVDEANDSGGPDNITVILVQMPD